MESKAKWQRPFISYARVDQKFALRLAADLDNRGKKAWIDTNLQGGEAWAQKLDEGLEASDVVLLIVSRNSRKSQWVNKELHSAQDLEKPVIPVIYKRSGSWSAIADLQKIDFIGWYEEGLARLLEVEPPPRRWWRQILIQLNRHGVQLLLILIALAAALAAYLYSHSPSETRFWLAGSDASAIVLLVKNDGGRTSTLLADTFRMQFDGLPVKPESLAPLGPARAIAIPGHDRVRVPLTFANALTPRNECDGAWCTKEQAFPLIPRAAIRVTGQVRESDNRIVSLEDHFAGSRVQKLIERCYPEVPEP